MNSKSAAYYGPFFWLALVSFCVPLVVAAKAFNEVRLTTKPTPNPDASGVDHDLWDYLLKQYVTSGLVDYDAMKRDYLFATYLRQLSGAEPSKLATDQERLAFLCNAYNAMVVDGVISHKVNQSVMDVDVNGTGFFDLKEHLLAGETVSLNEIEHRKIREVFQDPRIHVALVCAAKSCPAIRGEAYVGSRLNRQLDDQSKQFANQTKYVHFDIATNALQLSALLNWYGDDWNAVGGYLPWLKGLVADESLREQIELAEDGQVPVEFLPYDWQLNSQEAPANRVSERTQEFGSGTIPNG